MVARPSVPSLLRVPERRAKQLPLQPTPLIGRDAELAALGARLLDPEVRLLTLTGPPGTGKTRLAIAVAGDANDRFGDGVWFVGLETVREADQVVAAVARALGVREVVGQLLTETLATFLADRRLLLLLDNFEQVLPAAEQVAELLAGCPGLKVLVTSRAPLRLRWEHEVPVAPLALPEANSGQGAVGNEEQAAAAIAAAPAVQLFAERARAVLPEFQVTAENAAAVAEICIRLDGLPLAIELAAARVKLLSLTAILDRLTQRLALLTSGPRDLPDRHRTLRAALAWSYGLLMPAEQAAFRLLAVFVGGCTVDAAEAVWQATGNRQLTLGDGDAPSPAASVLDALDALLGQSLVRREQPSSGEPRLRMLETVREFALEQLTAPGEWETAAHIHAVYFLGLAEAAEPHLNGSKQAAWLDRLEAEHDNLRAALAWALAQGEIEPGLRLGGALWLFWRARGHLSEGRRHLDALLAAPGVVGHPAARAKTLSGAGNLAMQQGDFVAARALHEESLQLRRELGRTREVAASLNNLGIIAQVLGNYAEARRFHEESLTLKRELGDRADIAYSLGSLGNLASAQGDYATAHALYAESLAIRRELHDESGVRVCLVNLGDVAYLRGAYAEARARLEESLAIARALGDKQVGPALNTLGSVALRQGDREAARSYLEQALATASGRGDVQGLSYTLEAWAALAVAERHPERAARLFGAAQGIRDRIGIVQGAGDRELHDRDVAVAQEAMGEDAFAAAQAVGRAMSLEEAVADALAPNDERGPMRDKSDNLLVKSPFIVSRSSLPNGLTAREVEVLRLIAAGHSNPEIAAALVLSVHTVERHTVNIYAKIDARGRADATAYALRNGLA